MSNKITFHNHPIKKVNTYFIGLLFVAFVLTGTAYSTNSKQATSPTQIKCEQTFACNKSESASKAKKSFLSRLLDPEEIIKNITQEKGDQIESTQQNPSSNTSIDVPTSQPQQPTNHQVPTTQNQPTQAVLPTQATIPTQVVVPTATQAPTAAPQQVNNLHVTSCGFYDLSYCRSNGQTYNYTRLRVKRSDTGEVLTAATLNNGGGYFSGFPTDVKLDVILLPPTDRPDQCGDIKTIEFRSYIPFISIELVIRPSGSSPCITS